MKDAGKFHGNPNDTVGIFPSLFILLFICLSGALKDLIKFLEKEAK